MRWKLNDISERTAGLGGRQPESEAVVGGKWGTLSDVGKAPLTQ